MYSQLQMPAHYGKFVSYYRVSTDRQGRSGLGLEAQKDAVQQRLNGGPWQVVAEFVEIESGSVRSVSNSTLRCPHARSTKPNLLLPSSTVSPATYRFC